MVKRICFVSKPNDNPIYKEIEVEFNYYNGFAVSQKQKSISSMHESIVRIDKFLKVLEVSTKSTNPVGIALSAFNLKFLDETSGKEYPLENIFQSSKVFEYGGPYSYMLLVDNVSGNVEWLDPEKNESGFVSESLSKLIIEMEPGC